ncbi:hypothetical protein [Comamonas sp.]|uniref:hypothetical protein n=1 Tax=Comamonas sp. TaxID=34028 RepID=UPI0028A21EEB|nr:hypothetical protein [Comamonas sp.]
MSKSTFSLPESRIARRLVVTLSVTVNAERDSEQLHTYVGQALLEAANRVDVKVGTASAGTLLSHSYDHGSVEVHVGYSEANTCPKAGVVKSKGGAPDSILGNVEAACEKVDGKETEVLISAGTYRQPSQREILEQSLVHGAAAELASQPAKAGALADGIKALLDTLHPKTSACAAEASMLNSLSKHVHQKMDEGLAHHMSGAGVTVSGGLAAPKAESVHTQGIAHQVGQLVITAEMVSRFLSWTLPDDFGPDGGIYIDRRPSVKPTGTNLLNFAQAKAMLEHCINGPKGLGSREA